MSALVFFCVSVHMAVDIWGRGSIDFADSGNLQKLCDSLIVPLTLVAMSLYKNIPLSILQSRNEAANQNTKKNDNQGNEIFESLANVTEVCIGANTNISYENVRLLRASGVNVRLITSKGTLEALEIAAKIGILEEHSEQERSVAMMGGADFVGQVGGKVQYPGGNLMASPDSVIPTIAKSVLLQ